jgi:hypothetical protein
MHLAMIRTPNIAPKLNASPEANLFDAKDVAASCMPVLAHPTIQPSNHPAQMPIAALRSAMLGEKRVLRRASTCDGACWWDLWSSALLRCPVVACWFFQMTKRFH